MYCFFQNSGSLRAGFPVFELTRLCASTVHAKNASLVLRSLAPNFVISRIALNPLQQPSHGRTYCMLLMKSL
ncbi:hypothetical protein ATCV1_z062L [Acanthocystis turfacea chlorella virus 1]|uniref:Uncharacterized protein z062L n=1 Tax=Chlorovirus heliozoae TaxID=322019 RepID=A7K822_9PHYC|nr:hypothetical protein ATCV1_z062L [Acanthocystis turfacea chlorella virus 1]ABT16196.1 hypothetical protein ATCV1_z062L [Acanthocystis turfacea chlorella virus 1]